MTEEFVLSEKICYDIGHDVEDDPIVCFNAPIYFKEEDVKEFIRLLKERIYRNSDLFVDNMKVLKTEYLNKIINSLAGEKLI